MGGYLLEHEQFNGGYATEDNCKLHPSDYQLPTTSQGVIVCHGFSPAHDDYISSYEVQVFLSNHRNSKISNCGYFGLTLTLL